MIESNYLRRGKQIQFKKELVNVGWHIIVQNAL